MGKETTHKIIKRPALILCSQTIAACPINAVCIDLVDGKKHVCGHYAGSVTTADGSRVYCEFVD